MTIRVLIKKSFYFLQTNLWRISNVGKIYFLKNSILMNRWKNLIKIFFYFQNIFILLKKWLDTYVKRSMDLTTNFSCPCNSVTYASNAKLKAHQRTMAHKMWENEKMIRDLKCELTRRDNTISLLERKINERDQRILVLKERSKVLKSCLKSRMDELSWKGTLCAFGEKRPRFSGHV